MPRSNREIRANLSTRRMMILVAVFAAVLALTMRGFSLFAYHRDGPASENLFRPIIARLDRTIASDRLSEKAGADLVDLRTKGVTPRSFHHAARLAWLLSTRPVSLSEVVWRLSSLTSDVRYLYGSFRLFFGHQGGAASLLDNLRGNILNSRHFLYHRHLKEHYERLLSEHCTAIPPLPKSLVIERNGIEVEIRRMSGDPSFEFGPEPPVHLVPGSPKPNQRASRSARPSGWVNDSF